MQRNRPAGPVYLILSAAAALACTALSGCTAFSAGAVAEHSDTAKPAAVTAPGVPSGPAYYTHPEPSFVATDAPPSAAPSANVSVFVTYSRWNPADSDVELGSYVSRVIESGGTCTATLTQGSRTVTSSVPAMPDATSTSCGGLIVPGSQLSAGKWSAVISYHSEKHSGSSDPVQVTVP